MTNEITLSIVIPVYNSAKTISHLVDELSKLKIHGGHEIILVNDGSADNSHDVCKALAQNNTIPTILVEHSRNFGEHNAILTGLREAKGEYIITMDDDLQNPPSEVIKLLKAAQNSNVDVMYTKYSEKKHSFFRNFLSWLANQTANLVLSKPKELYLCSFRCMNRFVVNEVIRYTGPYPYVDGLIFESTNKVDAILVTHLERAEDTSNYTLSRLLRLWLSMFINFSVFPLRLMSFFSFCAATIGLLSVFYLVGTYFFYGITVPGYYSTLAVVLLFAGIQGLSLSLIGEYLGHTYLTLNGKPQSVIRSKYKRSE